MKFKLKTDYQPAGDQPEAIKYLEEGINIGIRDQVLLGITGSGKTFTMANIIKNINKPTMIMAHNKTLAAQLYEEMISFFPENAVEYFVSYYDYYQPEAYIPQSDTYIDKDSSINDRIDRLRHSATRSLFERKDVIIIASVSAIYGLGSPDVYADRVMELKINNIYDMKSVIRELISLQYERNDKNLERGSFAVRGDCIDIFPSHYKDIAWKLVFFGNELEEIIEFSTTTYEVVRRIELVNIYPNTHHLIAKQRVKNGVAEITKDLEERIDHFKKEGKLVEAQRIEQRTLFDIEMILEMGTCKGIENYSRYFSGRSPGEPPPTLFEYFPQDSIIFIDESHITIPQIGGMYNGDRARKKNLIEHGFRLPSALDNRPLQFDEWDKMRNQTIYVSATPSKYEMEISQDRIVEQVIRPTGLIDPIVEIRPLSNQVDDLLSEISEVVKKGSRVLVTTLTKKMSEDLSEYLSEIGIKSEYLHSEVNALERMNILNRLRQGTKEVLIGVNLLREGLDIPECALVAIMDADKEGFLRSATALIQTIGRAARNVNGRVVMYADNMTKSMNKAVSETKRRREKQIEYNKKHNITPKSTTRKISNAMWDKISGKPSDEHVIPKGITKKNYINKLRKEMLEAASELDFKKAAELKNIIDTLKKS